MTYILGWKSKGSAFIVADSAVTKEGISSTAYSSFGEMHTDRNGKMVEEAMLKLCCIKNKAIVAMAGDNRTALGIIEIFKNAVDYYGIKEAFEEAIISCGPYSKDNKVGLIVGYIDNGEPKLISFTNTNKIVEHSDFTQIGSIASYYPSLTENLVKLFINGRLADVHMLAAVTAVLQSYGIFDQLMNMHVGGVFFGLSIDASGIHWQNDTSYVIYNFEPQNFNYITVIERESAIFVNSTFTQDIRGFVNSINTASLPENIDALRVEAKEFFDSGKSVFYVFLSNKDRLITVVKTNNKLDTKYIKIIPNQEGHFDFFLSPELMEILKKPITAKDYESLPFRFNWRNCD